MFVGLCYRTVGLIGVDVPAEEAKKPEEDSAEHHEDSRTLLS